MPGNHNTRACSDQLPHHISILKIALRSTQHIEAAPADQTQEIFLKYKDC